MPDPTSTPTTANSLTLPGTDPMAPHLICAAGFLMGYRRENTRAAYALDLRIYLDWCTAQRIDPMLARRWHIQAFAIHLEQDRRNGPATVNRRVGTIRCYYEHAELEDFVVRNPCKGIKLPKVMNDPRKRAWLNHYEIAVLQRAATAKSPGMRAMVDLMAIIGMRVTAVCEVRIEHLHTIPEGYVTLHTVGKGEKPSVKVLPIPVAQAVAAARGGRREGWLIRRRDGSQMTRRSAAASLDLLAQKAGFEKKVTPHVLRRSCATNLLKGGADIRVAQDQLDHATPSITIGYDALGVPVHAQGSHLVSAMVAAAA